LLADVAQLDHAITVQFWSWYVSQHVLRPAAHIVNIDFDLNQH